jgi:hypothetical protein
MQEGDVVRAILTWHSYYSSPRIGITEGELYVVTKVYSRGTMDVLPYKHSVDNGGCFEKEKFEVVAESDPRQKLIAAVREARNAGFTVDCTIEVLTKETL